MINIGVIGLGEVSQLMHLPILHDLHEKFKIVAVSDVAPSLVDFIKNKYSVKHGFLSSKELITCPDVDAILVLSPDQYHGECISLALQNSKHVFVEKPSTLSSKELEEILELQKSHTDVVAMVGYMRRYSEAFLKAKDIMESSPLPTKYLRFRDIILEAPFFVGQTRPVFYPNDVPSSVIEEGTQRRQEHLVQALGSDASQQAKVSYQMLTGLGSHSISAVRELFGVPNKILSVVARGEHLFILMDFGDFIGTYELVNDQQIVQFDAAIEIFQDTRKLHFKYETPYLRYQPMSLTVIESDKNETKTTTYGPNYKDPFFTELTHFYDCIKNNKQPKTTLQDSMHDLKLFEEIVKHITTGGN